MELSQNDFSESFSGSFFVVLDKGGDILFRKFQGGE